MSKELDIIMGRIKECAERMDNNKFRKPCFVANDENMFECARDYFKNSDVEVVLNVKTAKKRR